MEVETGKHWSNLLKAAVLAMNSTKKREHGETAFRVMWGRQSRHEDLLAVANNFKVDCEEGFLVEQAILNETCRIESLDDIQQNVDVFHLFISYHLMKLMIPKSVELLYMRPQVISSDMSRSNRKYNMTRGSTLGGTLTIFACS